MKDSSQQNEEEKAESKGTPERSSDKTRRWRHSVPFPRKTSSSSPLKRIVRPASTLCSSSRFHRHNIGAGLQLLALAILTAPAVSSVLRQLLLGAGDGARSVGVGVHAAPCENKNAQQINITSELLLSSSLDLSAVFNCSDGEFEVSWSGVVNVSSTINVGQGTKVTIVGTSDSTATTPTSSNSSSDNEELEELSRKIGLVLPENLTAAVVGVRPPNPAIEDAKLSFGSIFYVDRGELILVNMTVRDGFMADANGTLIVKGGGIHAIDSNVTVTGCEFEDNFATSLGGGIFALNSIVVAVGSVFRRCAAGFQSKGGDPPITGAGGGISVDQTKIFIDGCLFDHCYASRKGGGFGQNNGRVSVVNSLFYNNTAGSDNDEDSEEIGEGGAISFIMCYGSFDSLAKNCEVNDTAFVGNGVARKGGAVSVASGEDMPTLEFNRCTVNGSVTGEEIKDNPQGEGGGFSIGKKCTVILSDSEFHNNYCGKKGGGVVMSSGKDWDSTPGGVLIIRNSTFADNTADLDNGGVLSLGEFCTAIIQGEDNVFTGNRCGVDGGVVAASVDSKVSVEGGYFSYNEGGDNGGVFWTKGELFILGGQYFKNSAIETGGAIFASEESSITLKNGTFNQNRAIDGGVVYVDETAALFIEGGTLTANIADNRGGAFYIGVMGELNISGGSFTSNKADFGGFVYKEGKGNTSCDGASIDGHKGVDGGAIYAVDGATLDWKCNLKGNLAVSGPAIYARDNATVNLSGITLSDNVVARGSVVFFVSSTLKTYEVVFKDSSKSADLSAVQTDTLSTYMAEDTSFVGFVGEAVVFSEGVLFLDDCDFSRTSASVLVYSNNAASTVIRNAVLGDMNYEAIANSASEAGEVPTASSLTNSNFTCEGVRGGATEASNSPCSEGSVCLNGDLGVYCQCYIRESTLEETCTSGDADAFVLNVTSKPELTYFPNLLEADLVLSLESISSTSTGRNAGAVVWNVSITSPGVIDWTVFPSVGMLQAEESFTIRVVGDPSDSFDGFTTASLKATGMSFSNDNGNDDGDGSLVRALAAESTSSTSASFGGYGDSFIKADDARESFDVTFYHCEAGMFWAEGASGLSSDGGNVDDYSGSSCTLCTDAVGGYDEVLTFVKGEQQ